MIIRNTALACALAAAATLPVAAQEEPKPAVAIQEFDYSTVMTGVQAVFGTNYNVGRGIKALLTNRITEGGDLTVVERANLEAIMKEQEFLQSDRAQQGSGARMGQIQGADVFLMGDITTFGRDDQTKTAGGIAGRLGTGFGGFGIKKNKSKAVVAIAYRMVDATTGAVVATGEARGESSRESKSFALGGAGGRTFGAGGAGMESSNFAETIIGEAVTECVNKLALVLEGQAENIEPAEIEISALVAKVDGPQIIFTAGEPHGVHEGQTLEVHRVIDEVKHPVTGEPLETITDKIGELTVTRVSDSISYGSFTGAGQVEVGDQVKTP